MSENRGGEPRPGQSGEASERIGGSTSRPGPRFARVRTADGEYSRLMFWRKAIVERHGGTFTSVRFSAWADRSYEPMERRWCYSNALEYANHIDRTLTYVEGFASCYAEGESWEFFPHAWCVDDAHRVVDPTWHENIGNVRVEDWRYFGIPFETQFVSELAEELHRGATEEWGLGILTPKRSEVIEAHLAARTGSKGRRPDAAFLEDFHASSAFRAQGPSLGLA
jgi:hypothetical protein